MIEQAVVLGADTGLGKAVVDSLISKNIPTKILVKDIEQFKRYYDTIKGSIGVIEGDMDNNEVLAIVCEYADLIFMCVDVEFKKWESDLSNWINKLAQLGAALNARIVFPSNKYGFGYTDAMKLTEEHPQRAHTEIGRLSVAFEQRLARSITEGASLTVIRFPTIFGPLITGKIGRIFQDALNGKSIVWPFPDADQELIYVHDAAEIMVRVAQTPSTADSILHVGGTVINMRQFITEVLNQTNNMKGIRQSEGLVGFIKKLSRQGELESELSYLLESAYPFDGTRLLSLIGDYQLLPVNDAIKSTLDWMIEYNSRV